MTKEKEPVYDLCVPFGITCRHCSDEKVRRPYSTFMRDPSTRLSVKTGSGVHIIELGSYCNNVGAWALSLNYCPRLWEEGKHAARLLREIYLGKPEPIEPIEPVVKRKYVHKKKPQTNPNTTTRPKSKGRKKPGRPRKS